LISYIIRRILILPVTIFGMTAIIFLLLQILGPEFRAAYFVQNIPKNDHVMEGIIIRYGLRAPIPLQYWYWLAGKTDPVSGEVAGGIIRGNLGYSRYGGMPVASLFKSRFPATVELAVFSLLPILLVGIWLGVLAGVHQNRWMDQLVRVLSIMGYSLPGFLLGILLLGVFYAGLRWFPMGRISDWVRMEILDGTFFTPTGLFTVDAVLAGRGDILWDAIRHLVLPVITLSTISLAAIVRITRSSLLETLRMEYIATARAKGLRERDVIYGHALPNAILPVLTYSGLLVAASLGGAVIVETIFNYPGVGQAAAFAASRFDVVTVLALTMLSGMLLILTNLMVDILYAVLDPRIAMTRS
jgi:ABC-type dipeptide/oligopeptide/nickel transport system permease component